MRVLGSEAEGSRVFVVDLVNVLVKGAIVQSLVREEMPCVFEDEEESDLAQHRFQSREGNLVGCETEVFCDGVEEPDLFTG